MRGVDFQVVAGLSSRGEASVNHIQGSLFYSRGILPFFFFALGTVTLFGDEILYEPLLDQGFNILFQDFTTINIVAFATLVSTILIMVSPHGSRTLFSILFGITEMFWCNEV